MRFIPVLCILLLGAVLLIAPVSAADYAIGDRITLSGFNYESEYTYLYIQGVNVPLQEIPVAGGVFLTSSTRGVDVNNNRWEVSFYLANRFDAGMYVFYACAAPLDYRGDGSVILDNNLVIGTYSVSLYGAGSVPASGGSKSVAEVSKPAAVSDTEMVSGAVDEPDVSWTVSVVHLPGIEEGVVESGVPFGLIAAALGAAVMMYRKKN